MSKLHTKTQVEVASAVFGLDELGWNRGQQRRYHQTRPYCFIPLKNDPLRCREVGIEEIIAIKRYQPYGLHG
jgi:hypothetical protein